MLRVLRSCRFSHRCAGRPARSRWCKSTAMKGVATHIGPKPCAGIREDVGEASAGERAAQPLSRDRKLISGADTVCVVEGNMSKSANASTWPARRGRRTWHARTLLVRNREVSGLAVGSTGLTVRGGKARSRSRRCTIRRSQTLP